MSGTQKPAGNRPLSEGHHMNPGCRDSQTFQKLPGTFPPIQSQPEVVDLVAAFVRMTDQENFHFGIAFQQNGIFPQDPPVSLVEIRFPCCEGEVFSREILNPAQQLFVLMKQHPRPRRVPGRVCPGFGGQPANRSQNKDHLNPTTNHPFQDREVNQKRNSLFARHPRGSDQEGHSWNGHLWS